MNTKNEATKYVILGNHLIWQVFMGLCDDCCTQTGDAHSLRAPGLTSEYLYIGLSDIVYGDSHDFATVLRVTYMIYIAPLNFDTG